MNLECHSRGRAGRVVLCVLEVEICRPASAGRGPYRSGKTRAAHSVKNVCGVRSASGSGIMQITRRGGPRGRATGLFGGVVRRVGPLCGRWPTAVGRMFLRTAS